ncbi:DUF1566 domain-containing protein [Algibacillus agarilyticus]|uniref:Lcl C-terminal domain-containing protein n=1 Tax=Algibacillus agarilyticus TaxID=2234133 RepID=UPI000DCFCAB0|nr:DUF1566 domain-containing protein [Algibacillus agarilyticus]
MHYKYLKLGLLASCLWTGAAISAQVCFSDSIPSSTPTTQFVLDSQLGIATDQVTGLSWYMCSVGTTWNEINLTCEGQAQTFTWQEALQYADNIEYADYTDWRLPNIKELMSIIERQCSTPALNTAIFNDGLSERYWSNTPVIGTDSAGEIIGDTVWAVSFEEGSNNTALKIENSLVRLVRKIN